MKTIPLSGKYAAGRIAVVSDEDFQFLSAWQWRLAADGYVRRDIYLGKKQGKNWYRVVRMHRLVLERMGFDIATQLGDHKDGDPLNNQRDNLRPATILENSRNRKVQARNATGLKGVTFHRRDKRYQASIRTSNGRIHLGYFSSAEEAHAAYCRAAEMHHGSFARFA